MLKAPSPPSIAICNLVESNAIKPCLQTALSTESVNFPVKGEKDFLGDVHRFRLICQHTESEVEDQILVQLKNFLESCLVSFLQTQDETFCFLKSCPGMDGMSQLCHETPLLCFGSYL